ncbi:response regulator [Actinobacillus equuli]|uniref:response regulator n=1 Tax=Actinobacillus equuli TaxID=718 RepID=UPI002441EF5C|nr:response regulator [Actinobacillus equuli]WGE57341.1 response regulator [Actinobacillus equuli subsp. equuli]
MLSPYIYITVDNLSAIISSISKLLWPIVVIIAIFLFRSKFILLADKVIEGKVKIKIGNVEISGTPEEVGNKVKELVIGQNNNGDNLVNKKVLWVDDLPDNNVLLIEFLKERNIKVKTVLSTDNALDILSSEKFDAIISDVKRPEGNEAGPIMFQRIKEKYPDLDTKNYLFCGAYYANKYKNVKTLNSKFNINISLITNIGSELINKVISDLYE